MSESYLRIEKIVKPYMARKKLAKKLSLIDYLTASNHKI